MVWGPDVEGVDLPSALAVIVILRARARVQRSLLSPETSFRLHLTFAREGHAPIASLVSMW